MFDAVDAAPFRATAGRQTARSTAGRKLSARFGLHAYRRLVKRWLPRRIEPMFTAMLRAGISAWREQSLPPRSAAAAGLGRHRLYQHLQSERRPQELGRHADGLPLRLARLRRRHAGAEADLQQPAGDSSRNQHVPPAGRFAPLPRGAHSGFPERSRDASNWPASARTI